MHGAKRLAVLVLGVALLGGCSSGATAALPGSSERERRERKERKKQRTQGGVGGRHAATTQGFKERSVVLAVAHPWASASSYLSSQSVADSRCNPHATPRSSYSRRSPVASSSVAPLSSASFCSATAACRSLALAASPASRRSSALLAAY